MTNQSPRKKTVSIIIPSYNEALNIRNTHEEILSVMTDDIEDYELLIIDDGSSDGTAEIIDELAKENPHVVAVHNEQNMGFGYSYQRGVGLAKMDYVVIIPGDNEFLALSIDRILKVIGTADIVIPFTMNMEVRPYGRRIISRLFTLIMNALFTCEIQYYNGPVVHRRDIIQALPPTTNGFAFQANNLVRLIRSGHSFVEVGVYLRSREGGQSSSLKIKNVISVIWSVAKLFLTVHYFEKEKYTQDAKRVF